MNVVKNDIFQPIDNVAFNELIEKDAKDGDVFLLRATHKDNGERIIYATCEVAQGGNSKIVIIGNVFLWDFISCNNITGICQIEK